MEPNSLFSLNIINIAAWNQCKLFRDNGDRDDAATLYCHGKWSSQVNKNKFLLNAVWKPNYFLFYFLQFLY